MQHQLAISFGCCCDGAGLGPRAAPHRPTYPRLVPHPHIATAANPAGCPPRTRTAPRWANCWRQGVTKLEVCKRCASPPPSIIVLAPLCFGGRFTRSQTTQPMCSGNQCHSLSPSRVWLFGTGDLVLLAVWLVHVYVRHKFEPRNRHKVCPCCLGGAVVVLLCATTTLASCRRG